MTGFCSVFLTKSSLALSPDHLQVWVADANRVFWCKEGADRPFFPKHQEQSLAWLCPDSFDIETEPFAMVQLVADLELFCSAKHMIGPRAEMQTWCDLARKALFWLMGCHLLPFRSWMGINPRGDSRVG